MHAMNIPTAIMKASTALAIGPHITPQSHAKKPPVIALHNDTQMR